MQTLFTEIKKLRGKTQFQKLYIFYFLYRIYYLIILSEKFPCYSSLVIFIAILEKPSNIYFLLKFRILNRTLCIFTQNCADQLHNSEQVDFKQCGCVKKISRKILQDVCFFDAKNYAPGTTIFNQFNTWELKIS